MGNAQKAALKKVLVALTMFAGLGLMFWSGVYDGRLLLGAVMVILAVLYGFREIRHEHALAVEQRSYEEWCMTQMSDYEEDNWS